MDERVSADVADEQHALVAHTAGQSPPLLTIASCASAGGGGRCQLGSEQDHCRDGTCSRAPAAPNSSAAPARPPTPAPSPSRSPPAKSSKKPPVLRPARCCAFSFFTSCLLRGTRVIMSSSTAALASMRWRCRMAAALSHPGCVSRICVASGSRGVCEAGRRGDESAGVAVDGRGVAGEQGVGGRVHVHGQGPCGVQHAASTASAPADQAASSAPAHHQSASPPLVPPGAPAHTPSAWCCHQPCAWPPSAAAAPWR